MLTMSEGIVTETTELIALRRYTQAVRYQPDRRAVRAGNHLSKVRGRGMDFDEVRNYQAGDDVRHMEWRVTARTGTPHVKLYQEERERPAILCVDFNPSMFFGTRIAFKSVIAAKLAALLAWTAVEQGDRVGGLLFADAVHSEFTPKTRNTGVLPFLAALSEYTHKSVKPCAQSESDERSMSEALLRLRRVTRPGSFITLISDFYHLDEDSERHLRRLRAHNDILAYQICDPLELAPPKPQQYAMTNGQHELLLDTANEDVARAYQDYCERRTGALQSQFRRLQIPSIQVTAAMDLPLLVKKTYPRRAHG